MELQRLAVMFGCTVDQVKAQYRANAEQCKQLAEKATKHKSGKWNGQTADYWSKNLLTISTS